jgi:alpha-L-arabinofuranosidase
MYFSKLVTCLMVCLIVLSGSVRSEEMPPSQLTVYAAEPAHEMSPLMYGLFFEDINFAADGGLYAELIWNRSFEFTDKLFNWRKVERDGGAGQIRSMQINPLHENNPNYLQLSIESDRGAVGIANPGFGGIVLEQGKNYRFSVYARAAGAFDGKLSVHLEKDGAVLGQAAIGTITSDWTKYTATLRAQGHATDAQLLVLAEGKGRVDIDFVSLFPEHTWRNQPNGLRADLVEFLKAIEPAFIRFPGGCIVEGRTLDNAYRWKDTIGDPAYRKHNWNRWSGWNSPPQYYQSYGLGFFEYFRLCSDLGAEPVPIINCGMACQYESAQLVPLDELDPWIQDALDLIEFANGPVDSTWGARRAAMGHPEPFHLKYLGVGNEQWDEMYFVRYQLFYDAIKKKYPDMKIVSTSGPSADGRWYDLAWNKFKSKQVSADIVDEHYYMPPEWFLRNTHRYDRYDRKGPKVFAGEYAAHNPDRRNDLFAALAEAAFLTGLERNGDIVTMTSYAPLLAKLGSTQWRPDLVWFDNMQVYGSPSYYVQKLFGLNRGTGFLKHDLQISKAFERKPAGRIGLMTWRTDAEFKDVKVTRNGRELAGLQDLSPWNTLNGRWSYADGVHRQSDRSVEGATRLAGDTAWTDYTLSLKARKIGGSEGFIIKFRQDETDTGLQWNLGGWGNTKHAIQGTDGILTESPGRIETDRWYDIRIELSGTGVRCLLDGQLIHKMDIPAMSWPGLFASTTVDDDKGQVALKVVNPAAAPAPVRIAVKDAGTIRPRAVVTTLTGNLRDENSLDNPKNIAPVTTTIDHAASEFSYTFEPMSLTVIVLEKQ